MRKDNALPSRQKYSVEVRDRSVHLPRTAIFRQTDKQNHRAVVFDYRPLSV